MRGLWTPFAFLILAGPLVACAGAGGPGAVAPRDPEIITLQEIQATQAQTAYEVVQQLRPRWMLRNRGDRSFSEGAADFTKVSVDGMPPREFDHLKEISKTVLVEIRRLSPSEATMLYGTGFNAGLIKVTTRH